MSDKKNSPIVETTVLKGSEPASDHQNELNAAQNNDQDQDTDAHFDSIAELARATAIVDADGNPVNQNNNDNDSDAAKKARLADDLAREKQEDTATDDTKVTAASSDENADNVSKSATRNQDQHHDATKPDSQSKDNAQDQQEQDSKNQNAATTESQQTGASELQDNLDDDQKEAPKSAQDEQNNADEEASDADNNEASMSKADNAQSDDNQDNGEKAEQNQQDDQEDSQDNKADKTTTKKQNSAPNKLISGQHRVAIIGGNRIPFARSNGAYSDASNIDMLTAALNGLIERFNLQDEKVGEVVAGAVLKLSRDLNLTRESALNTALDPHTPAYDISQACATGLQATFASANKIALGIIDSAITGGVDTTSDAPIAIGDGLRKVILKLGAAKNNKERLKALLSLNPKELIDTPQNGEPRTGLSMGEHQAITTLEWNISREDQDKLAFNSHKNLARAYDDGFFDDLITPYKGLTRDDNLRPDSTLEKMGKLKPAFGKDNANPTMTAANSTPLTDGASVVLLANEDWAEARGLNALAYITHQETAAVDFIGKSGEKEGLLMAPAYAVPRMLERAGLSLQDFDFYEIHEAFASQVLSTLAAWEDETFCKERLGLDAPLGSIDRDKLNVNGSSLAAGHPFAATGGRILATAAKLLDQKGSGRALISICAAGGQGVTCILEK